MLDNHEISNCESVGESSGLNDSYSNSDDETFKPFGSSNNNLEDFSKNIDDEEWFGPSFFQRCVHWVSISRLNNYDITWNTLLNCLLYFSLFLGPIGSMQLQPLMKMGVFMKNCLYQPQISLKRNTV